MKIRIRRKISVMRNSAALESHNQKIELMVRTRIFESSRDLPVVRVNGFILNMSS